MDKNNGLEDKFSKEEIRITITIDLQVAFPHLIRIFPRSQSSHMGISIRAMEDLMINAKINHSVEAMEIDPEMDFSTVRMGTGETMGTPLVLHPLKERLLTK